MSGLWRELVAVPPIVVILSSQELRDPQELSKVTQKEKEKCLPMYRASYSLVSPGSPEWVPFLPGESP